jgi:hypothetical protein
MEKLFKVNTPFCGIAVYDVCPPLTVSGLPVVESINVTVTGGAPLMRTFPLASFTMMDGAGVIGEPAVTADVGNGVRIERLEAGPASGCAMDGCDTGGVSVLNVGSDEVMVYDMAPVPLGMTPLNVAMPLTKDTVVVPLILALDDVEVEVEVDVDVDVDEAVVLAMERVTDAVEDVMIFPPASTTATDIEDGKVLPVVVYGLGCEMKTILAGGPGTTVTAVLGETTPSVTVDVDVDVDVVEDEELDDDADVDVDVVVELDVVDDEDVVTLASITTPAVNESGVL